MSSLLLGATATVAGATRLRNAGIDALVAYHSSVYRDRGLPSVAGLLPWGSANEQTLDALPGVVEGAADVPVVATICANDGLLTASHMVERVAALGARGVLNAPTVGLLEGAVRQTLEAAGLGRSTEIELVSLARRAGLDSWSYVFDRQWIAEVAEAGATGIILHLGITTSAAGSMRPWADRAAELLEDAQEIAPGLPALLHGGPLNSAAALDELRELLSEGTARQIGGFFGASAFGEGDTLDLATWRAAAVGSTP
jgi:predicted TIM-barrel enzyme